MVWPMPCVISRLLLLFARHSSTSRGHSSTSGVDELQSHWAQWNATSLSSGYAADIKRSCFCPPEVLEWKHVVVENDVVQHADPKMGPKTINSLFELIQRAYAEKADTVKVTYHESLGYPTSIFIDWSKNMADEESSLSVRNVKGTERPALLM